MNDKKTVSAHFLRAMRGNRPLRRAAASAGVFLLFASAPAFAGTDVLGGNAVLQQLTRVSMDSNGADAAVFSSSAASGVLDWSKFNVGEGQSMTFNGSSTTFFNLVGAGAGKSQIDGIINGSGNVWVINPDGIAFGANSSVNVGGVFAAAAQNLANEDAIRNGSSLVPEFGDASSGALDASGGEFVADQVALIGRTVTVSGAADFTGAAKVDVGAGRHIVVDDIGGGMVSLDFSDFSAQGEDVLNISGLTAGDAFVDVVANGRVSAGGEIRAGRLTVAAADGIAADADIATSMGEVELLGVNSGVIAQKGSVRAATDVSIIAADGLTVEDVLAEDGDVTLATAGGDIVIDGTVRSGAAGGEVLVKSATDANRKGSIIVNGELNANENGGHVVAIAGYGALERELAASGGDAPLKALLAAAPGDARPPLSAPIQLSLVQVSGTGDVIGRQYIVLRGENGVYSAGTIDARTATLEVYGHDGAEVEADKRGVVNLSETSGDSMGRVLAHDFVVKGDGDIIAENPENELTGLIEADPGETGHVSIKNGWAEGEVEIGNIVAEEFYYLAAGGTIRVVGDITAPERIELVTGNGDIVILDDCTLTATGDDSVIRLTAGGFHAVKVDGTLDAGGEIAIEAGSDVALGEGSSLATRDPNGTVTVSAVRDATVGGSVGTGSFAVEAGRDATVRGAVEAGSAIVAAGGDADVAARVAATDGDVAVSAGGDATLRGAVEAQGGVVLVSAAGDITVADAVRSDAMRELVDSTGGLVPTSVRLESTGGRVSVLDGGRVEATHEAGTVVLNSLAESPSDGGVSVAGELAAGGARGAVSVNSRAGALELKGGVDSRGRTYISGGEGGLVFGGSLSSGEDVMLETASGSLTVNGTLASSRGVYVSTGSGTVTVNGRVSGGEVAMVSTDRGSVRVNGTVSGGDVLVQSKSGGDVSFGPGGVVRAAGSAIVKVGGGSLLQSGNGAFETRDGYVEPRSYSPAIVAGQALLDVAGSIGSTAGGYFAVAGGMYAFAGGDARIAAAWGQPLRGGTHYADVLSRFGGRVSLDTASADWANNTIKANGNLAVYSSSSIDPNGLLVAGGNLTVSAAEFGNMSYLQAGGRLRVQNVGRPSHPQLAYFESVNGVEPRIEDLPNDVLVFVDGRLAGGNLQMISKMGAMEAFPVSTPELKSEQGIFGNPVFLHGDLDVAEPLAVGQVDYLIQEVPRLLLSGDFPVDVDRTLQASGLNPKDIYRFGQRAVADLDAEEQDEPALPDGDRERKAGDEDEKSSPSFATGGPVAMR